MADSNDLMRLLQAKHEAVRAYREAVDEDARVKAWDGVDSASNALEAELVARAESAELEKQMVAVEAREAAAKKLDGMTPVAAGTGLPVDDIRAFARGERGPINLNLELRTDITDEASATYAQYLKPQTWASSVINFQIASSGLMSAGPTILNTTSGNVMNMPRMLTDATTLPGAEGTAATQSNPVWDTIDLGAYRFDGYFSVSNEILSDSGVNLESLLRDYAARSVAAKVNPYFTDPDIGTGSSTISAVQVGCTSALTAASNSALTLAELKQLYYSVLPVYRASPKCAWVGNSALTLAVAQMVDDNGQYLWNPQLAASEADRLMGKPWHEDAYMDSFAAGNEPVIFGDIAAGYTVRYSHGGMQFIVSKEFAVTSFETTFVWGIWVDGVATDKLAIKSITLP